MVDNEKAPKVMEEYPYNSFIIQMLNLIRNEIELTKKEISKVRSTKTDINLVKERLELVITTIDKYMAEFGKNQISPDKMVLLLKELTEDMSDRFKNMLSGHYANLELVFQNNLRGEIGDKIDNLSTTFGDKMDSKLKDFLEEQEKAADINLQKILGKLESKKKPKTFIELVVWLITDKFAYVAVFIMFVVLGWSMGFDLLSVVGNMIQKLKG